VDAASVRLRHAQERAGAEAAEALLRAHEEVGGVDYFGFLWGEITGLIDCFFVYLFIYLSIYCTIQAAALGRRAAAAEANEAAARGELEALKATTSRQLSDGAVRFAAVEAELSVWRQQGGEVRRVGFLCLCFVGPCGSISR
jgi:hypothetical protein